MKSSSVIAFTSLFQKITRKASIGKRKRNNRKTMSTTVNSASNTTSHLKDAVIASHHVPMNKEISSSSCSSSEIEELEELDDFENDLCKDFERQSIIHTPPSNKSTNASQIQVVSSTATEGTNVVDGSNTDLTLNCVLKGNEVMLTAMHHDTQVDNNENAVIGEKADERERVKVRDFAYPVDSPLHFGKTLTTMPTESRTDLSTHFQNDSHISLSSPDFNGRDARALYDFVPETEYEVPLKAGQLIWVQYRQCPGWLVADVEDETGLVPEFYVEFI
ncbi:hypothetical protein BDF20DRAFT_954139 [Mycotypha africana]|uniref:uncharacterized protein n=1 Tax=Mycotypha africana TaxID=64632 RepID=UPI002300AC33|nr:uncharacterized protein BDF20DRAFT_954139 [Mycotypha africana]KAI8984145.1 hypothetical protein BDF20DRAFT_954139 [Mycotypha africana]